MKKYLKQLKSELINYQSTAESLKRQNRELRHTLNVYDPRKDNSHVNQYSSIDYESTLEGPRDSNRRHRQSSSLRQRSRTPVREAPTIQQCFDDDGPRRRTPKTSQPQMKPTPSDSRLNKLINDYRMENDRCTQKINELKHRLAQHTNSKSPNKN